MSLTPAQAACLSIMVDGGLPSPEACARHPRWLGLDADGRAYFESAVRMIERMGADRITGAQLRYVLTVYPEQVTPEEAAETFAAVSRIRDRYGRRDDEARKWDGVATTVRAEAGEALCPRP